MALREKVSLNQFLLNAIAAKVGAASYHNQLLRKLDGYFLSQSATENTSADRRLTLTVTLRDERPGGIQWQDKSEPTAPRLSMTM